MREKRTSLVETFTTLYIIPTIVYKYFTTCTIRAWETKLSLRGADVSSTRSYFIKHDFGEWEPLPKT